MNTAALKALADQCICHPASRGIADIEAAGEGLKHLISQLEQMTADRDSWAQQASDRVDDAVKFSAQLEDAQGEIRAMRDMVKKLEKQLTSIVTADDDHCLSQNHIELARALLEKKK